MIKGITLYELFLQKIFMAGSVGALIIGVGTYLFLSNYLDREEIIVAAKDLAKGDFIGDDDIYTKPYLKSALPENYLTKKSELIGKVVLIDRKKDDPITSVIFEEELNQSITDNLKKGEVLLTLNVGYQEPILDELEKGKTISIVSTEIDKNLTNSFYYNTTTNEGFKNNNNENNYLNSDILQISEKIVVISSQVVIRNLEIVEIKKNVIKEKNIISNNNKDTFFVYIKCKINEAPLISYITKEDKYKIIIERN